MSKQQNYGGAKVTEREDYLGRKEGVGRGQSLQDPWWATSKANLILVPIFSAMDGMVLFSIFDACLTQSEVMGVVMSLGIAVVLNVLPLIMAKFANQAIYKIKKQAVTMLIITSISFFVLFAGTVMLRFAYSDMYESEDYSLQLENTVSNEELENVEDDETSSNKSVAVVILLSLSPLVTSVIGFCIVFVSDDEVRKQYEYCERRAVEIDEAISDMEAAIETMEQDVERDLALDEQAMIIAIEEIIARGDVLKALARYYLAMYLGTPEAISRLACDMLVYNEKIGITEKMSEVPDMLD